MSEPKASKVYDFLEYDLGTARDGNKAERIIWDRFFVLKCEAPVYYRKDQNEKWIDLQLIKKIDISPAHHSHFYLKNSASAGKTLILAVGREASFETEAFLSGLVGLLNLSNVQINPATLEELEKKINKATTPAIYNVTMTLADTEYSQALPANTKKFLIHTRDGTTFRLAFETGKVATPTAPYFTIPANQAYNEDHIEPSSLTLYFACGTAGKVIEIIVWS